MSDTGASAAGAYETEKDAGTGDAGLVRLWLDAIALARKEEESWRKAAEAAVKRYRAEHDATTKSQQTNRRLQRFPILYSNICTTLPAVYNSTPVPDVRRRFGDADPVGKIAAQVLERSVSYMADVYDFDAVMRSLCFDVEATGRGIARVKYEPTIAERDGAEYVADEAVICEHVDWQDFIRGPGRKWTEVPWIAFEHRLTRDELTRLAGDTGRTMQLDVSMRDEPGDRRDEPEVFKRGTVYEVWDKQRREVLFVAPSVPGKFLRRDPDPLRLKDFWPIPRPVYAVTDSGSMVPVVPFSVYEDQADELDRVTQRIAALVKVLRYRGVSAADIQELSRLNDADDGEFVSIMNWQQFMGTTGGAGLDRAFFVMPVDKLVLVVRELVQHREAVKQTIYEITGISDILRGASAASETATAQSIKARWGSLRVQDRQAEVQRLARDLVRLKAEIIAERFQPDTLAAMTGINLPTAEVKMQAEQAMAMAQQAGQPPPPGVMEALQTPSWDDVMGVLHSDAMRSYRVDIETDSTIRGDLARAQENIGGFVQGFAGFVQALGPAILQGFIPKDVAADLMTSFARTYKLGRQAEDALDRLSQGSQNAPPSEDPANAERAKAEAAKMKAEADMQVTQAKTQGQLMTIQAQAQSEAMRHQQEMQRMQAEGQMAALMPNVQAVM